MRCFGDGDPLMQIYHDEEWGVPVHDDHLLFQKLLLDGFQAGLSWRIILNKRDHFREAFEGFNPERMAQYGENDIARLLGNPGIVRNRLKVRAAVTSARAFLEHFPDSGSFDAFLWNFVGGRTRYGPPARTWAELPTSTPQSDAMSKALKGLGFKFVGTTICYAFMQAVGMVDDHLVDCFRYRPR
ncbi:MAG: DNA-3-methyladenine glycosylase I [Anaerolineales bacterium]|nr:DNA-3-methyladenine glycosylase I [Anaerolineales bacterium]